jgi:hypothetical protein
MKGSVAFHSQPVSVVECAESLTFARPASVLPAHQHGGVGACDLLGFFEPFIPVRQLIKNTSLMTVRTCSPYRGQIDQGWAASHQMLPMT